MQRWLQNLAKDTNVDFEVHFSTVLSDALLRLTSGWEMGNSFSRHYVQIPMATCRERKWALRDWAAAVRRQCPSKAGNPTPRGLFSV